MDLFELMEMSNRGKNALPKLKIDIQLLKIKRLGQL